MRPVREIDKLDPLNTRSIQGGRRNESGAAYTGKRLSLRAFPFSNRAGRLVIIISMVICLFTQPLFSMPIPSDSGHKEAEVPAYGGGAQTAEVHMEVRTVLSIGGILLAVWFVFPVAIVEIY